LRSSVGLHTDIDQIIRNSLSATYTPYLCICVYFKVITRKRILVSSARDLAKILGYRQYNKFLNVIQKAEEACRNSGQTVEDHFTHMSEMVRIGSGAKRRFDTVFLSRYACYLIVQNADPEKPIVALVM
jgi:prophage antirepressor-like protein